MIRKASFVRHVAVAVIVSATLSFVIGFRDMKFVMAYSSGVALSVPIKADIVPDASLISSGDIGFILSAIDYDPAFYGVVTASPAAIFEDMTLNNGHHPVTTTGTVLVRVVTKNGAIKKSDNVTTSSVPGVGMKADFEGYIVGTSQESCEEPDPTKECLILVSLAPRFSAGKSQGVSGVNLFLNIKKAASSPFLSPLTSMRYLLAVATTAISFALGFFFFGRHGKAGIEALGRNPLAANKIGLGMAINMTMTVVAVATGLLIAYMILIL